MLQELYEAFDKEGAWTLVTKEGVSLPEIAKGVQNVVSGVVRRRGTTVAKGLEKARAGSPLKVPQWRFDPTSGTMSRASGRLAQASFDGLIEKISAGIPSMSKAVKGLVDRGMKNVGSSLKVPKPPSPPAIGNIGKGPTIEKIRF